MQKRDTIRQNAPMYVTANSLVNERVSLRCAMRIARAARVDGFEIRRELLPQNTQANDVRELRS